MNEMILNAVIDGLVDDDIRRIENALRSNDPNRLTWLRSVFAAGITGYENVSDIDLMEEFRERGLKLVAVKEV